LHVLLPLQELKKKLAKAESVLKLAEICRKLETEQEKVLPFWSAAEAVPLPGQEQTQSSGQLELSEQEVSRRGNQLQTCQGFKHSFATVTLTNSSPSLSS
jgi:hypothetical protein